MAISDPPLVRPITDTEYDTWCEVMAESFHSRSDPEDRARDRPLVELNRALGAFDDGRMVGTAGAISFQMSVPGGVRPAAGVTRVSVLPSHRRRGALRGLMSRQLNDIHEGGEAIAALYASESSIYRRFGYGCAAKHAAFTLRRGEGGFVKEAPTDPKLRIRSVGPAEAIKEMATIHDEQFGIRPGIVSRSETWWELRTREEPENRRKDAKPRFCVLVEDDSGPRGYALYTVKPEWDDEALADGQLDIEEILAVDPASYAVLWRHLLDRDLVSNITAWDRPPDDPLYSLLADPRRTRTRLYDNLWVRLVDVGDALAGRHYARPIDMVIDVRDEFLPWNAKRWRLEAGNDGARCEPSGGPADIVLSAADLASGYLGGGSLGSVAGAGLIEERRSGAVRVLSTALSWEPLPCCPTGF